MSVFPDVALTTGGCHWLQQKETSEDGRRDYLQEPTTIAWCAHSIKVRLLLDEVTPSAPRRFLIDVEETMRIVLEQEDTDNK